MVRQIEENFFALFPNEVADSIMVSAGNFRQSIMGEEEPDAQSNLSLQQSMALDISGWEWMSGNSKNIEEKLKFALKIMRNYLYKGNYHNANAFNHEYTIVYSDTCRVWFTKTLKKSEN